MKKVKNYIKCQNRENLRKRLSHNNSKAAVKTLTDEKHSNSSLTIRSSDLNRKKRKALKHPRSAASKHRRGEFVARTIANNDSLNSSIHPYQEK